MSLLASLAGRNASRRTDRGAAQLRATVQILESLQALPLELTRLAVASTCVETLRKVLEPFGFYCRLWVHNPEWKMLQGIGPHPGERPGALQNLPTKSCPAFATQDLFLMVPGGHPCPAERLSYGAHVCLPITLAREAFGVLLVGAFRESGFSKEELSFLHSISKAVALAFHRYHLMQNLHEKVEDLRYSYEVGATTLASYISSTQSIDQTTIQILDGVIKILKADRAVLMLWNPESQQLETYLVRGTDYVVQSRLRLQIGEGIAGWALRLREPYWAEYAMGDPHYLPSGRPIQSLLCVPLFASDGQPLGVINATTLAQPRAFSQREIDVLKLFGQRAALALENAQLHQREREHVQKLKELDQMKSQFLSSVTHELKGPLTGIRGFCEALRLGAAGRLTPPQEDLLIHVQRQVDLQERMVQDLVDLARMEKGQWSLELQRCDLEKLLREEFQRGRVEAIERGIAINLELPPQPTPSIMADEQRIRQVLWNLLYNAFKCTPEGGQVHLRLNVTQDAVHVSVEDTGYGLPPETLEKVFEKFYQIPNHPSQKGGPPQASLAKGGLGLGLAICRQIVQGHGGRIWASSEGPGHGATFSFTLPLSKSIPLTLPSPPLCGGEDKGEGACRSFAA